MFIFFPRKTQPEGRRRVEVRMHLLTHLRVVATLLTLGSSAVLAVAALEDDFSKSDFPGRRAIRGDWTFNASTATCTQDDALFKKLKDHGPILFYDVDYGDGAISFSFKPDAQTKVLVFTANGANGHLFRFGISTAGMTPRAFPLEDKEHKSVALGTEPGVKLHPGEWASVRVVLKGNTAAVTIGDFTKTYEHPSIGQPKNNFSIGFSFGTVSVKGVALEK
jgi:hypothetical protein